MTRINPANSEISRVFASVPLESGQVKYVPLAHLPVGTELMVTTKEPVPPISASQIPNVNGEPEKFVVFLSAGTHHLRILDWNVIDLSPEGGDRRLVKPLYSRMSITSPFIANFDKDLITYKLQSGSISKIQCGPFKLDIRLLEDSKSDKRIKRRSRRHGPRGKYHPLRQRRF